MANRDLQGCAKLLSHIMLETDNRKKPPAGQGRLTMIGNKGRKEKPSKEKGRRGGPMIRKHVSSKPDIDEIDENVQRMIRIKKASESPRVINEKDQGVQNNIPEKDTGGSNTSGISAPYNQRLASSTPHGTPSKGKASVKNLLKGDVEDHALNSFEFIRTLNPQSPREKGPTLKQGQVDFKANPLQTFPPRAAFMQQHLQGMREAYMQNIQTGKPSHNAHHDTQVSTHNDVTRLYMQGLPSTIPAPIVLSASQPTIYPHVNQPVLISTGPGGTYAYNLPQGTQHTQLVYQPATQIVPPTDLYNNEPPERDNAHYSLYSSNEADAEKRGDQSKGKFNEGHSQEQRPISPFKIPGKKADVSNKDGNKSQPSRAEILQSALKIALDDNGYIKSGPISPFKAGIGGFSGFGKDNQNVDLVGDVNSESESIVKDEIGVQTEGLEEESDDADSTLIENETNQLKQVGLKKGNDIKSNRNSGNVEVKKVATKNKKVQFVPGKKKAKDLKARKNGTHGAKVVKSTARSTKETQVSPTLANKSESIQTKPENNKAKGTTQIKVKVKPNQQSNEVEQIEDNKENVKPVEVEGKPGTVVAVVNQMEYNSIMKKAQHLVKELKAVPGLKIDREGKRLLKDIEETLSTGNIKWQTELDLAIQPMRSENSQLRRKVRILTQQMKDKETELDNAEKPDTGFVVVHLQMKVYNLENEIKALTQLNSKLKEEVKVYVNEVERLSSDRAQMLDLFGNKDAMPSTTGVSQKTAPVNSSKTELESYKREKRQWDREKSDFNHKMELMTVHYKQKEEELVKMQELVRNLQGSMNRLLEDLQSTKPCPTSSMTRLNHELQEVEAIMSEQKERPYSNTPRSLNDHISPFKMTTNVVRPTARQLEQGRTRQTRSLSADGSFNTKSPQKNTEPELVKVSQYERQSAYRSRSQQRDAVNQRVSDRQEKDSVRKEPIEYHYNYKPSYDSRGYSSVYRREETTEDRRYRQYPSGNYRSQSTMIGNIIQPQMLKEENPEGKDINYHRKIPSTHPAEKVGLFLMDEPGLNFKKMAETLSDGQRVSMSTDITEYQGIPGMSPMKGQPFEKLDPFIKDLIYSQKLRDNSEHDTAHQMQAGNTNSENRFKSPSESILPNLEKGSERVKYNLTDQRSNVKGQETGSLQNLPQNNSQEQSYQKDGSSRISESKETVSSAPTVKELLTPIADRMERFKHLSDTDKSRAVRAINFDQAPTNMEPNKELHGEKSQSKTQVKVSNVVDLDDTYNMDLEGEIDKLQYEASSEDASTTLSEKSDQHVGSDENHMNYDESRTQSESRYSVTDYFKKYPQERKPIQPRNNVESILEHIEEKPNHQLKIDLSSFQDNDSGGSGSIIDVNRHIAGIDPPPGMDAEYWAEKVLISPHGIPVIFDDSNDDGSTDFNSNDAVAHTFRSLRDLQEEENIQGEDSSPQQRLYQGTDLDTSLSSINEMESIDTVTSTTSISSVDDRVFRQGLANLDANIARVQQSLRQKMF